MPHAVYVPCKRPAGVVACFCVTVPDKDGTGTRRNLRVSESRNIMAEIQTAMDVKIRALQQLLCVRQRRRDAAETKTSLKENNAKTDDDVFSANKAKDDTETMIRVKNGQPPSPTVLKSDEQTYQQSLLFLDLTFVSVLSALLSTIPKESNLLEMMGQECDNCMDWMQCPASVDNAGNESACFLSSLRASKLEFWDRPAWAWTWKETLLAQGAMIARELGELIQQAHQDVIWNVSVSTDKSIAQLPFLHSSSCYKPRHARFPILIDPDVDENVISGLTNNTSVSALSDISQYELGAEVNELLQLLKKRESLESDGKISGSDSACTPQTVPATMKVTPEHEQCPEAVSDNSQEDVIIDVGSTPEPFAEAGSVDISRPDAILKMTLENVQRTKAQSCDSQDLASVVGESGATSTLEAFDKESSRAPSEVSAPVLNASPADARCNQANSVDSQDDVLDVAILSAGPDKLDTEKVSKDTHEDLESSKALRGEETVPTSTPENLEKDECHESIAVSVALNVTPEDVRYPSNDSINSPDMALDGGGFASHIANKENDVVDNTAGHHSGNAYMDSPPPQIDSSGIDLKVLSQLPASIRSEARIAVAIRDGVRKSDARLQTWFRPKGAVKSEGPGATTKATWHSTDNVDVRKSDEPTCLQTWFQPKGAVKSEGVNRPAKAAWHSTGNVDPEILMELPQDIQQMIQSEMKRTSIRKRGIASFFHSARKRQK